MKRHSEANEVAIQQTALLMKPYAQDVYAISLLKDWDQMDMVEQFVEDVLKLMGLRYQPHLIIYPLEVLDPSEKIDGKLH